MGLSHLNGRRIVVRLSTPDRVVVVRGTGQYVGQIDGPKILRVELDSDGERDGKPVIVIDENLWSGNVLPDTEFGCDYRIEIGSQVRAN